MANLYQARDSGLHIEVSRESSVAGGGRDRSDRLRGRLRPRPPGLVCFGSALAYWDLSDENPTRVDLAVPAGTHRPQMTTQPRVHVFGARHFGLGRMEVPVGNDLGFRITDPERTVVDCFRQRHRLGVDLAVVVSQVPSSSAPQPGRVLEMAEELRVRTPILEAMRVLQG